MISNAALAEVAAIVPAFSNTLPSSSTPRRVSLKGYSRMTIILSVLNATTVTGSAVTVKQATDVTNSLSDEKAVAFTTVLQNIDYAAADAMAFATVSSNTFTTTAVNSKEALYVIDVTPDMLDIDGGFDCVRVGLGNGVATLVTAVYVLHSKYGKSPPYPVDPGAN